MMLEFYCKGNPSDRLAAKQLQRCEVEIRKLLANGEERAARELRLQVLWTRQLGEELVAIGAPVVKTIDDCLDPERAYWG